jgi:hypothetical protein
MLHEAGPVSMPLKRRNPRSKFISLNWPNILAGDSRAKS